MLAAHLGPEFFTTLLTWSHPSPWCLSDLLNLTFSILPLNEAVLPLNDTIPWQPLPGDHFALHGSGPMAGLLIIDIQLFFISSTGNIWKFLDKSIPGRSWGRYKSLSLPRYALSPFLLCYDHSLLVKEHSERWCLRVSKTKLSIIPPCFQFPP